MGERRAVSGPPSHPFLTVSFEKSGDRVLAILQGGGGWKWPRRKGCSQGGGDNLFKLSYAGVYTCFFFPNKNTEISLENALVGCELV